MGDRSEVAAAAATVAVEVTVVWVTVTVSARVCVMSRRPTGMLESAILKYMLEVLGEHRYADAERRKGMVADLTVSVSRESLDRQHTTV